MGAHELAWYAATGEPLDKAGAYNVYGLGGLFVESLSGSPSNVAGLPVRLLLRPEPLRSRVLSSARRATRRAPVERACPTKFPNNPRSWWSEG